MSAHDGTQSLRFIHRPGSWGIDVVTYTLRLALFLPDAGPIWVRDFGRDDFGRDDFEPLVNLENGCVL